MLEREIDHIFHKEIQEKVSRSDKDQNVQINLKNTLKRQPDICPMRSNTSLELKHQLPDILGHRNSFEKKSNEQREGASKDKWDRNNLEMKSNQRPDATHKIPVSDTNKSQLAHSTPNFSVENLCTEKLIECNALLVNKVMLRSWASGSWISGDAINATMQMLQNNAKKKCFVFPSLLYQCMEFSFPKHRMTSVLLPSPSFDSQPSRIYFKTNDERKKFVDNQQRMLKSYTIFGRGTKKGQEKVNMTDFDLVLFPCNVNQTHWVLITLQFPSTRKVLATCYDSLNRSQNTVVNAVTSWLKSGFCGDFKHIQMDIPACPQQANSNDCGVFVCAFAEAAIRDCPLDYVDQKLVKKRRMQWKQLYANLLVK